MKSPLARRTPSPPLLWPISDENEETSFVLAALASTLTCLARADDIQLQMVGNIYANTCLVDSASKDLTVDLGQAASSEFHDVGIPARGKPSA